MTSFTPKLAVTALLAIMAGCSSQDSSFRSVSEETQRSKTASATKSASEGEEQNSANATATSTTSVVLENEDAESEQTPSALNVETIIEEPAPSRDQSGTGEDSGTGTSETSDGDSSNSDSDSGQTSGGGEGLPGDGHTDDTTDNSADSGSDSGTPTTDPTTGTTDGNSNGEDLNTTIEMHALCADRHDTTMDKVKVVNGEKSLSLKGDEILLVKVAGNKSKVHITTDNISVSANKPVLGICIFVTGNQAQITADFKIDVGALSYFGAGNRSSGNITVGEGFQIGKMAVKLRGNEAALKVTGSGSYDCPEADLAGHNTAFNCQ